MSKLEVGMYVRLQNDVENIVIINRIANVFKTTILTENDGSIYQGEYTKENITKASYNIIDLIEVGDVLIIKDFVDEACMVFEDIYYIQNENQLSNIKSDLKKNKNKQLYSIVTREQFESMSYRIGDDK